MFFSCLEENNFIPQLPEKSCDIIYLCSPNNPTGMSFSYNQLKSWVDFAKERNAIIFYDGAYSSFITSDVPRSIFEIPDAKDVCIEFRSFSKMAGFTNLRCSYVIIPKNIDIEGFNLRELWKRRIGAKFGGVPYPIQRGAHILYTSEGQNEIKSKMASYHLRAAFILQMLRDLNFTVYGGIDAPYVWCKTPHGMSSFTFFDYLLEKAQIVGVPGSGFGKGGEGFIRFSAFQHQVYIEKAFANIKRIKT